MTSGEAESVDVNVEWLSGSKKVGKADYNYSGVITKRLCYLRPQLHHMVNTSSTVCFC